MRVRELLQIEIWSKRTSRKILICFAVAIVGFVTWIYLDGHWLTHGEREAGRSALMQIDSLQLRSLEDDQSDFDVRKQQAQKALEAAEQRAWTTRDKQIASALSGYLGEADMSRDQMKMDKLMEQRHIVLKNPNPELDAKLREEGLELRHFLSVVLHNTLDK